jgi:predicted Zn-ribbon and HTH transcriptional regulator
MSPSRPEQIAFSKSQCQPLSSERRSHVFLRDHGSSSQSPVIGVTAQMLPARPRHDGVRFTARLTNPCVCPWCHSNVIYRERWPGLTSDYASATVDRERLRYGAGWFCTNPTCDYRRLSDDSGDVSSDSSVGRRS